MLCKHNFLSNAQQVKRCASYEYLKSIDQKYPGTEQYVKDLPNQISNDNHKNKSSYHYDTCGCAYSLQYRRRKLNR